MVRVRQKFCHYIKLLLNPRSRYVRIEPKNLHGAPARGATVILHTNIRNHAKTIDAGSGYLCQMEPVAHFGLRNNEIVKMYQLSGRMVKRKF